MRKLLLALEGEPGAVTCGDECEWITEHSQGCLLFANDMPYRWLDMDSDGNPKRCDECRAAERKARMLAEGVTEDEVSESHEAYRKAAEPGV